MSTVRRNNNNDNDVEDLESMFAALDRIEEEPPEIITTPTGVPIGFENTGTVTITTTGASTVTTLGDATTSTGTTSFLRIREDGQVGIRVEEEEEEMEWDDEEEEEDLPVKTPLKKAPGRTPNLDRFMKEVVGPNLEHLRETLEGYYPDRYEIVSTNILAHKKFSLEAMIVANNGSANPHPNGQDQMGAVRDIYHNVYIYFPTIEVSNGNTTHLINDLYIRMTLNFRLQTTEPFRCCRERVTLSEYRTNYRHSHARAGNGPGESQFCFGETPFATTVSQLMIEPYTPEIMEMFLIHLSTYLSWESLEGGPHVPMRRLSEDGYATYPSVTQGDLDTAYSKYLDGLASGKFQLDLSVDELEGLPRVRVANNDQLWIDVSKCVNPSSLLEYDPDMRRVIGTNRSTERDRTDIKNLNATFLNIKQFTFKGKSVGFSVIGENKEDKKKDIEKRCQKSVNDFVAQQLFSDINKYFMYEFKSRA